MLYATLAGVALVLSHTMPHETRATLTSASGQPVLGIDISSYQHSGGPIDWLQLARDGVRFVAIKATEGTYYVNPYYASDLRAATAAGIPVLAYAFANPTSAGGAPTARYAMDAASDTADGPPKLPLVVDLEDDPYSSDHCYGLNVSQMIAWIAGFVGQTKAWTGENPIIYTTYDWWQQCTGFTGDFSGTPLWLASYGVSQPAIPSPWQQWTFWQYTSGGDLSGIGNTDLDYFYPTSALSSLSG